MCERKKTNTLKTATGERLQFLFAFYFGYYRRWRYLFTSASFRHRNIAIAKRASKKINKCKKKLINEKIKCQRESLNQRARLLPHQPLIFFNKQREIRRWRGDRAGFISPPDGNAPSLSRSYHFILNRLDFNSFISVERHFYSEGRKVKVGFSNK